MCGKEAGNSNPAPDIFLKAAEKLEIPPEECLVLEDSVNGLKAAKAAGCMAAVVPDLTPAPPEEDGLWDWKVSDLGEMIPIIRKTRISEK